MKRYSTCELRHLEVINLSSGARLGYASDFEFDADARVLALVIRGSCGFFGMGQTEDLVIPWNLIECIGEDTILVRLSPHDFANCTCPRPKSKKHRF